MDRKAVNDFASRALTLEHQWLHDPALQAEKANMTEEQLQAGETAVKYAKEAAANFLLALKEESTPERGSDDEAIAD